MILRYSRSAVWTSFVFLGFCFLSEVNSVAVMSIDLGMEWMKVAVVSPGVPMEIALNKESKRKTPVAVAFRDEERLFGSEALNLGTKYPKNCYFYLLDLLGKYFNHPSVRQLVERFPYYEIEEDPDRGTVLFRHDQNTTYSPEELVAMVLGHAKEMAESFTDQKVKDAVIVTPVYFGQAERRSLMTAADLAGLNVLQLVTEPMAVALNYGMFRRKEINETAKYIMFYDKGALDTTVSVVSYQNVKTKERGYSETHPQAQILGIGYDRFSGGCELRIRLRDFLAEKFNEMGKTKTDIWTNHRAMSKLLKEAERVKLILSANNECYAQVENIMEDIDFKVLVTRADYIELNKDHFTHEVITKPIVQALEASGKTMQDISDFIIVGAGTRVPKIQETLMEFLGHKELGKSLNTDESAAMGAVYKAADLSTGFKVKKFITKEAVLFPIEVNFERAYKDDYGTDLTKKVQMALFSKMYPFPQKKVMTFNKFTDDFAFDVGINNLDHLAKQEIGLIGNLQLSHTEISGLKPALENHTEANEDNKGVKAHFHLDESGLLTLTGVEAVFEQTISVEQQEKEENEAKKKSEEVKETGTDDSWSSKLSNLFSEKDADEQGTAGKSQANDDSGEKNDTEGSRKKAKNNKAKKEKEKPKKPLVITHKEPLEFKVTYMDLKEISESQLNTSRDKLKALDDIDQERKDRETALNDLESFILNVKTKLYEEIYEKSSTEDERETILSKFSEITDWIEEEVGPFTEVQLLKDKLQEVTDVANDLLTRVKEHEDRGEIMGALLKMVNSSEYFLGKAKNMSQGEDAYFTEKELDVLSDKVEEVKRWIQEKSKEIEETPMTVFPTVTNVMIGNQGVQLDREVQYLVNKARILKQEREKKQREKELEEQQQKAEKEKEAKKRKKKGDPKEESENQGDDAKEGVDEPETPKDETQGHDEEELADDVKEGELNGEEEEGKEDEEVPEDVETHNLGVDEVPVEHEEL